MNKKYHIHTFGCQMNVHDSEKIAGIFTESGYQESDGFEHADVIVFNTCSIRQKAEQKFYSELGRLKRAKDHKPDLKIAVAGCISKQIGAKLFKRFPYLDFVFGPNNIDNLQDWINSDLMRGNGQNMHQLTTHKGYRSTALKDNPDYHNKILPVKRAGQVSAWVSIMYGCDNFCAYCVVPYTRGRERSRPADDIYKEVEGLVDEGFVEITLLGQNVNSYGKGMNGAVDFPDLLRMIHNIQGLKRIRFVTSHPRDFSAKLIGTIGDLSKVCKHLHLPLQSGSDRILDLMNRGYTYKEYKEKIDILRNAVPDIAITTDVIIGFPGESDEDFQRTADALTEIGYDGIYSFKYSRRPGTRALSLPDHVDEEIKSERLTEILNLQETITYSKNKSLEGSEVEILVEGVSENDSNMLTGRTSSNKIVNFSGDKSDLAQVIKVKILKGRPHSLYGEKIQDS